MDLNQMTIAQLLDPKGFDCACGCHHDTMLRHAVIQSGALAQLPEILQRLGAQKPFIVCDRNTYGAAGQRVEAMIGEMQLPYTLYCFPTDQIIEPDEFAVGQVVFSYDPTCDLIVAVGGGVINDVCKILAKAVSRQTIIVGTAPSMDGFVSNSASMVWGGVKSTIYTPCPVAVIADIDIMRQAPMRMLQAGLGDMLAKYVSICEWRISNVVNGEYYCPQIAALMRSAVEKIVQAASGLAQRDPLAVQRVVEGLVLSGIAMSFARVSRPASGLEHYFSHIFDMYTLEHHTPGSLHGIQVGIGTVLTLGIYEKLICQRPDREKALAHARDFDHVGWEAQMRRMFGKTAENVIEIERKAGKNDAVKHAGRLERILETWPQLVQIMREELPSQEFVRDLLVSTGAPVTPAQIGIDRSEVRDALMASREIRDKYIASSLLWDLGVLDEYADALVAELA